MIMAEPIRFPGAFLEALIQSGRGRRVRARCQTCDRYTEQMTLSAADLDSSPLLRGLVPGHPSVCLACGALHAQAEPFDD
jgi:hypothetical protein